MVPIAVQIKSGLVLVNTARQVNAAHIKTIVNAARSMSYLSKIAHSTVKRPIHKNTTFKNSNFNQRVNIVRGNHKWILYVKGVMLVNVQDMTGNMILFTDYEVDQMEDMLLLMGTQRMGNHRKGHLKTVKAFRVFNSRTRIVEENLHISFSEHTPNVVGYNSSNGFATCQRVYDDGFKPSSDDRNKVDEDPKKEGNDQEKEDNVNSTNNVNAASTNEVNVVGAKTSIELSDDPNMPELEDYSIFKDDEDVGFEDPYFPDRVYKVEKALYGLHQAPRAWYETLSTYLLDNEFQRGKIDKTLFIKRHKGGGGPPPVICYWSNVYVYDIIFGSTKKELCNAFEKLMHEKFQMSSMGELTFFLGLQVQQKNDGIFISQDKYVDEILKKFGFTEVKTASTPIETQKPLLKDEDGEEVDVHMYRYQVNLKVSHLHAVKRIFRYLKGQPKLGLWYPKDSPFDLVAYTDSDYAGASLDRKSTTRGKAKKSVRLMMEELCKNRQSDLVRKRIERVAYEVVYKKLDDSLVRAATTASSLEAEQDGVNIEKTQSKATPNEVGSQGTTLGGGPRR
ncbi:uncharacterized mitochondrial protein-like protein [Tanacetum coccineum]